MNIRNKIKKFKKFPFLSLMILSSVLFGIYFVGKQVLPAVSDHNHSQIAKKTNGKKETNEKKENSNQDKKNKAPINQGDDETTPEKDRQENKIPFEQQEKKLERVEDNYLDGALFIGDSRTTILHDYGGWTGTDFFVKNGLTAWTVLDTPLDTVNGTKEYLTQILDQKIYPKIYIMLGINELGEGNPQSFAKQFQLVLDTIAQKQPHAILFLEEIIHVTQQQDGKKSYINNGEINRRNEELKKITNGINCIYLPINEAFDLEGTGTLNTAFSGDGIHVQTKNLDIWKNFLLDHGVNFK